MFANTVGCSSLASFPPEGTEYANGATVGLGACSFTTSWRKQCGATVGRRLEASFVEVLFRRAPLDPSSHPFHRGPPTTHQSKNPQHDISAWERKEEHLATHAQVKIGLSCICLGHLSSHTIANVRFLKHE